MSSNNMSKLKSLFLNGKIQKRLFFKSEGSVKLHRMLVNNNRHALKFNLSHGIFVC